ncbi:MAG TPA: NAD(P)/FAD-dependent oxidoreductase [Jatrophihabitans sp.]|nr:NAD(P)/FAD-dependent oxidoreductase [Jatrophihabitans sp.]
MSAPRVLVAGGGYVGLYAALRLRRARRDAEITLVNPDNYLLFRPLLPEVASGTLEARHAAVPLREALHGVDVVSGRLAGLDAGSHTATVTTLDDGETRREYDHAVIAVGAVSRMLPVPGLAEHGIGFTSVAEALFLRNHVLGRLETAHATPDRQRRERALTFVFVGGGYSGVEALAELQDLATDACRWYPTIDPRDMRWVLVEAADRLLPSLPDELESRASKLLVSRGVDIKLETQVAKAEDGAVELSDGTRLATDTLVAVAGVAPNPVLRELGLPLDDAGRLPVDACLRVAGVEGVWAAGDCAAVPDTVGGGTCPPTAQYALREGRTLGDNLAAALDGREPEEFRYRSKGQFVTLGNRKGVASLGGLRLDGSWAWALRRAYYCAAIPTGNRKLRTLADWLIATPGHHDSSNLRTEHDPKQPFEQARAAAEKRN